LDIEAFARSVWIINPDVLTARIRRVEGRRLQDANLEAVRRIEAWLEASIRAHQTVGVETVLSTDKYRRLVLAAKELGFEVRLTYVILDSPERSIERVRWRIAKGGHAVPEHKIVERYARSLDQLPWFLEQADQASVFDNSFGQSSQYVYGGWRLRPFEAVQPFYVKVSAGLTHGYRGQYRDKIPLNGSGVAPVIVPSAGFCISRVCSELILFGGAGFLVTLGVLIP